MWRAALIGIYTTCNVYKLTCTHDIIAVPDCLKVHSVSCQHGACFRMCDPARCAVSELPTFFLQEVFGFDSPPLHDPTAVAYVIDPSLFQVRYRNRSFLQPTWPFVRGSNWLQNIQIIYTDGSTTS